MRALTTVLVLAAGLLATPVQADIEKAKRFWDTLRKYELIAVNDYRSRNVAPAVLDRSHGIWDLQSASKLEAAFSPCTSAARNLSHMVSSTYYDSRLGRVPVDWHYLSSKYLKQRGQCLDALGLRDDEYPLPWWFGM